MNEKRIDSRYTVRYATLADKAAVLGLNVLVYGGRHDYLPAKYDSYIRHWNTFPIICEFNGKVVGFMFCSLTDGGETVVRQAGRIDVDYQGKAISDRMFIFFLEQLFKVKRNLKPRMEALTTVVERGDYLLKKHAHQLFCQTLRFFSTSSRALDIINCFQESRLPYPDFSKLFQLRNAEIRSLLLSPDVYRQLFYGDRVLINSVPYKCTPESVWDVMSSENMTVFADKPPSGKKYNSVSFGCPMYVLSGNNLRYDITIYANDKDLTIAHCLVHIYSVATTHKNYNILFTVGVEAPIRKQDLACILHKFGIEEDTFHNCSDPQKIGILRPITELLDKYDDVLNIKLPSLL